MVILHFYPKELYSIVYIVGNIADFGNELAIVSISTFIAEMAERRNRMLHFFLLAYINKLIQTFVNPLASTLCYLYYWSKYL